MVAVLVIVGVVLCCGLCGYGINSAVRRARERREKASHLVTPS
jgi:sulfite exporter TauE/SafE